MSMDYQCNVDINFTNGDVKIEVTGGEEKFSFISGLGFMALPEYFLVLLNLYKREATTSKVEYYGNWDYYNFSSDGTSLQIEYINPYSDEKSYYIFNLKQYASAVDKAFSTYIKQYRKNGITPFKSEDHINPLGETVIKFFNEFSTVINDHKTK
ncbi:hypothetical protein [Paenisporosarcina sp. NPDC076898]|uniref:hypothetical protein n=1 Tax=unclassified Paenisporosarcina TaxID=2642018 RepID=UPI003D06FF88